MSPTILRTRKFRIVIYPKDHLPEHVHVYGPDSEAKFELRSLACIYAIGFSLRDLKSLKDMLRENQDILLESWYEWQE